MYICHNISLNTSQNDASDKIGTENQNWLFFFHENPTVYDTMWKNKVESASQQMKM